MKFYNAMYAGMLGALLLFTPAFTGCGGDEGDTAETEQAAGTDEVDASATANTGADADAATSTNGAAPTLDQMKESARANAEITGEMAEVLKNVKTPADLQKVSAQINELSKKNDAMSARMSEFQADPDPQVALAFIESAEFQEMQKNGQALMTELGRITSDPELAKAYGQVMGASQP